MEQAGKKIGQKLYKGDIDKIMRDINAVMDLHSQGLPADSHFVQSYGDKWKDHKNFINSTFGDISGGAKARPSDYMMINPVLVTDRPSRAVFKTYRLDRLNKATRMEGTTGIPMDYNMVKANYMPEGVPLFDENGDPVDMRYTPVADESGNLRAVTSENYGRQNGVPTLDDQGRPVAQNRLPDQARQMPEDYRISHQPSSSDSRLFNLTDNFPEDIYSENAARYYGSGNKRDARTFALFESLRGKPNASVTIYRVVPKSVNSINHGDWITLSKEAATEMNNSNFLGLDKKGNRQESKIISKSVKSKDITWPGDSPDEFGYFPEK